MQNIHNSSNSNNIVKCVKYNNYVGLIIIISFITIQVFTFEVVEGVTQLNNYNNQNERLGFGIRRDSASPNIIFPDYPSIHYPPKQQTPKQPKPNPPNFQRDQGEQELHEPVSPKFPSSQCDGVCMNLTTCLSLGGTPKAKCPSSTRVTSSSKFMNNKPTFCCEFDTNCVTESSDTVYHYYSPNYPAPVIGNLLCHHQVRIQPGVCGIRLDFLEFNTSAPLDRGLCHIDQFLIINSLDGAAFPRCGHLTKYSTIVPVDARHRLPLILLNIIQSSKETFKWNIKIKQLKCEDTKQITDYPGCGKNFDSPDILSYTPQELKPNFDDSIEDIGFEKQILHDDQPSGSFVREFETRESPDNAFYIEYLKQSYQALVADGPAVDPNTTYCKNTLNATLGGSTSSASVIKQRIIRGNDAALYEFPWQVSIQDFKGHICGGALISEHYILSASHCFMSIVPIPIYKLKIIIGDLNLNTTSETVHLERHIDNILFHSHFDPYYLSNDIALIKLSAPIPFRKGIQPICLPQTDNSYVGRTAIISGWGATHYPQGKLATKLQRVETTIMETSECKRVLKTSNIFSNMMCALAPKCSGTCFGDSGGPLIVSEADLKEHIGDGSSSNSNSSSNSSSSKSRLIGIVSFGIGGCALLPYWPDVYTRVAEYIDWLSYATTPN